MEKAASVFLVRWAHQLGRAALSLTTHVLRRHAPKKHSSPDYFRPLNPRKVPSMQNGESRRDVHPLVKGPTSRLATKGIG